jgi:ABC-type uncharacterized transport system permease subunit
MFDNNFFNELLNGALLFSVLRIATPLFYVCLGGFFSEKSGVVNVALEGFMMVGAFSAAAVAFFYKSAPLAWVIAFIIGCLYASAYAFLVIELKAQQIVTGMAMNILALGIIPFISKLLFNSTGSTPSLDAASRFEYFPYIFILILFLTIIFGLKKQYWGLWLNFAGEHPEALATSGTSVRKVRWVAVVLSGGLAAWGGATLSLALASSYSPQMTAGRGFIALAALIFGRWSAWGALAACLFFALAEALQIRMQGVLLGGYKIPVEFIQISPYILTLLALSFFNNRHAMPKYLGR